MSGNEGWQSKLIASSLENRSISKVSENCKFSSKKRDGEHFLNLGQICLFCTWVWVCV